MDVSSLIGSTSVKETTMAAGVLGFAMGILLMIGVMAFIWYLLQLIANFHIFKKAGQKGWKGLIPFYNLYVQFGFTWKRKFFWIFLGLSIFSFAFSFISNSFSNVVLVYIGIAVSAFAGIANILIIIVGNYRLSVSFGHSKGWTVGLVVLSTVFLLMLAFGKSKYLGNVYLENKKS